MLLASLLSLSARAEDLVAIYQLALQNDPRFRAAEANYKAVRERLPQARAGLLPTLSATAARNRNDEEVVTESTIFSRPAGQARYYSDEYRISLTQPIYNAALWANLRQASAEVRRAEAEFFAARQDLILRVAQAYLAVLLAQEALSLAHAEKEALARHLESAEGRKQAGLANITEVNDARARFQAALAAEIAAANAVEDAQQALAEISGRVPGVLANLRDGATLLTPDPPDMNRWIETALEQNFALRAAREAVEVAREGIDRNRAAHYPVLDAIGNRSRSDAAASIPGPGFRSDSTVIGLQVTVPIYQGGLVNARTEEAIYRYEAALQDLEGQRRNVQRVARSAFQGIASGSARIDALRQAVSAAESALAAKSEGRAFGLYTTLDVLDATRDLYRVKRDYAEARHLYLVNFLRLKNAAGTLSEEDVLATNAKLQ